MQKISILVVYETPRQGLGLLSGGGNNDEMSDEKNMSKLDTMKRGGRPSCRRVGYLMRPKKPFLTQLS